MFTGTVIQPAGLGCWLIEQDLTRDCIFAHQRHVKGRKFLHVNDRVHFVLIPNSRRPGNMMADEVEIVGLMVARQVSDTAVKS